MNKNNWKKIVLVVVMLIFISSLLFWGAGAPPVSAPPSPPSETQTPSATPATPPASQPTKVTPPAPIGSNIDPLTVRIVAPAPSAQWVQGVDGDISWNGATGIPGAIYLVNAGDGSIAGWISQQVIPSQTKYEWNARDLFLSRTSPTKKTVLAGQYMIKVIFDGGNPEFTISSGIFSIVYPSQVQISTYNLSIQNYAITPSTLTVKKGSKLIFANNDSVPQQLLLTTFSPITIQPGASYTFDTSILEPAPHTFYSNAYPTLRTVVTVQ
ncbi:MAG: hypothetical protein Q8P49_01375 [Candidatus Liptonbacteria bacterium]|nr:hypothetical protein [Candidatus Liptonbacteria bacterium]